MYKTLNYLQLLIQVAKKPSLLNPKLIVNDIQDIQVKKLQECGIKYIIFDKDNTLTITHQDQFFNNKIIYKLQEFQKIFGNENLGILSNSTTEMQNNQLNKQISMIKYKNKKPFNYSDIQNYFKQNQINQNEIAFIGDRLMTDVLLGNMNNQISIYCKPLERSHEKKNIKILRCFEEILLNNFFKNRKQCKIIDLYNQDNY